MKLYLLIPLLLFASNIHAQKHFEFSDIPVDSTGIFYERIVKLDSTFTKERIYNNAKLLLSHVFKESKEVIQLDDKEGGRIVCRGGLSASYKHFGKHNIRWQFAFDLTIKDGKYRLQMFNFGDWYWMSIGLTSSTPWQEFGLGKMYMRMAKNGNDPGYSFFRVFRGARS